MTGRRCTCLFDLDLCYLSPFAKIIPPRMTTRSACRSNTAPPGGGTGGRVGVKANGGVGGVHDFSTVIAQQFQNLLPTLLAQVGNQEDGVSLGYEQMWDNQKVKYTDGSFVGKALTCWNSQIHTKSQEAAVRMAWEDFKTLTREEFCLVNEMQKLEAKLVPYLVTPENKRIERYIYGLAPQIHKAIRNGSLKKNIENMGNGEETSRDRNVKYDNKRTRTGNAFATTTNPVRRESTGMTPKCMNYNLHHSPESPCRACFSCNFLRHLTKDYRVVPKMVNLVNARNPTAGRGASFECGGTNHFKAACLRLNQAQRPGGGHPNQVMAIDRGQGHGNNGNRARGGAFMLGAEDARQDPNIMTGFSYEIEIASRQLVEIDKVIRGYELEIEGHTFNIDLIPFGSESFDVIIGIDWLSKHKAEIICHEKVVRIPLQNGKTLRVVGERPEEKVRYLRSAKTKEQKKEYIVVVRNFSKVFQDDLSGLPPNGEIEFRIDLIPIAIPVAKSPYLLA
ncbi:putative reverse transcriptase domain-containing protein, partial [Tanacetum coccineum]